MQENWCSRTLLFFLSGSETLFYSINQENSYDTFLHRAQKIHYNHFSLHQIFSCLESFVGNSPPHFGSICTTRSLQGDNHNTYNEHHRGKSCKLETASRCLLPMSLVTSLSPALICEFPSQQIHPQPRLVINSTVIWTHGL